MSGKSNTGELSIELKSDLCAGSGYSYAGIIDSDICYDSYGIPYIPARRIKGCLRETLEGCLYSKYKNISEVLFGRSGDSKPGSLVTGNAYIEGYEQLIKALAEKKKSNKTDKEIAGLYCTQNILGRFTHVVGQTRMENGTAADLTLRYTRAVNQYSPFGDGNLKFVADISYTYPSGRELQELKKTIDEFKAETEEAIKDAARATRHIGLKRNRGFGNVKCRVEFHTPDDQCREQEQSGVQDDNCKSRTPDGQCMDKPSSVTGIGECSLEKSIRLEVRLKNIDPLMLSSVAEDTSRTYITGQSLLGAMAGRYLAQSGNSASEEFGDLFLNGRVRYSNLYPCDDTYNYYPAPFYINKLKKTKKYVRVLGKEFPEKNDLDNDYKTDDGNLPKKLKGKYVCLDWEKGKARELEVMRDIVYHHSHYKKGEEQEGMLYAMEVIHPGQYFSGTITLPEKYRDKIKKLLEDGDYYFGKSRSSQYGRCRVISVKEKEEPEPVTIKKDNYCVITFLSDAVFLNDEGEYTVYRDEIENIVRNELGLNDKTQSGEEYISNIQTTLAAGYQRKWNLRRQAVPAVAAGSCLVFRVSEEVKLNKDFTGERNLEGYGQIRLTEAEQGKGQAREFYQLDKLDNPLSAADGSGKAGKLDKPDNPLSTADGSGKAGKLDKPDNPLTTVDGSGRADDKERLRALMAPVIAEAWIDRKKAVRADTEIKKLSNTAVGRLTLMLKESVEHSRYDKDEAFRDFARRVESIKTISVKDEGIRLLKLVGTKHGDKDAWKPDFGSRDDKDDKKDKALKDELKGLGIQNAADLLNEKWYDYLMYILTMRKYEGGDL